MWAWTSIAFFLHVARVPQKIGPVARYVSATIWWILVTQWCFGAPIMDKVGLFGVILTVGVSWDGRILSVCQG